MNSLHLLISIFVILICLDLVFMVTLHFFHDKTGYYKYAALIWLGMLLGMVSDTLAYPFGLHHIFGGPFLSTPAFFYALLISKLYEDIDLPLKKLFVFSAVGWGLGVIAHFGFGAPFWLSALFLVAGGVYTYLHTGVLIWKAFRKDQIMEKMYASALILEGLHLLDYPFLRNAGDRVLIAELGFGFAIVLVYFASILNPVLINRKIAANMNSILKTKIEEKVEELQSMHVQLQESRKMAALGEMAGGVAHEVNTPLATILLRADQAERLLGKSPPDIVQARQFLRHIVEVCQRISGIVKGLRSFARSGDHDPFEPRAVKDMIRETLDLCSERLRNQGIRVSVADVPVGLTVECRAQQISQVILNLVTNASHAIKDNSAGKRWIAIDVIDDGPEVVVKISDSGPGVPENIRHKILEPFFTTKGYGDGTGLGLSISKGIIEDHYGRLFLDVDAKYTTFVIRVPKVHGNIDQVG